MIWPGVDRWRTLVLAAGGNHNDSGWHRRLQDVYAEPQRFYHNQIHIAECLTEFDEARDIAVNPIAVEFALWFHDAVYLPQANDNEEQSAALAERALAELGISKMVSALVCDHIMATKSHCSTTHADGSLVLDIDLSILGRPPARFFEYEEQIQKEYAWVPVQTFKEKRVEILEAFLKRPRLFSTERFFQRFEDQARLNLTASIAKLRGASQ